MRRRLRPVSRGGLIVVWFLAYIGVAYGEESPASVATRFVEALEIHDYAEVVKCIYEPWMYSQLDSLCADLPGISLEERELCAKSLGARSLSDFAATPKLQFAEAWARHRWPRLFPPEPPAPPSLDPPAKWWPICRSIERPSDKWSRLIVRTSREVIEPPRAAFVVLDVRPIQSFQELALSFVMHKDVLGEWRIAGVRSELVAE